MEKMWRKPSVEEEVEVDHRLLWHDQGKHAEHRNICIQAKMWSKNCNKDEREQKNKHKIPETSKEIHPP